MLLVAEGAVALDDPVSKYLPAFGERDKDAVTSATCSPTRRASSRGAPFTSCCSRRSARPASGCSHTRGPRVRPRARAALRPRPRARQGGRLRRPRLHRAGCLVEAVSHQSLDAFCAERIFEPLGMQQTFFVPLGEGEVPRSCPSPRAPHGRHRELPLARAHPLGRGPRPQRLRDGRRRRSRGLFATADDVMKFAQAWLDVWHGRSERCPASWRAQFSRAPEPARRARTGPSAGTRPPKGQSSSGPALLGPHSIGHLGFTGHLAVDRPRARGRRRDAHQPRPPDRQAQPLRAATPGPRRHPRSLSTAE